MRIQSFLLAAALTTQVLAGYVLTTCLDANGNYNSPATRTACDRYACQDCTNIDDYDFDKNVVKPLCRSLKKLIEFPRWSDLCKQAGAAKGTAPGADPQPS